MVNISEFREYIIDEIINRTIFLAKSIDEIESLLKYWNLKQENVIAVRTSTKMRERYRNIYVYELKTKVREFSTQNFFRNYLFTSGLFEKLRSSIFSKGINLWMFRTYEWCKDLERIGNNKVLLIDYDLYIKLNNKIWALNLLEGNDYLRSHLEIRTKKLKTRYEFNTNSTFYKLINDDYSLPWVISSQISNGGDGVFKIANHDDFKRAISKIKTPVVKIEKFIENCIPVNQFAIIFFDKIIKYQPSRQIIEEHEGEMRFKGSDFKLKIDEKIERKITKLTHFIGLELQKLGYRGIFGCDYIISDNEVYFIEINPRFQGSTFLLTYNDDLFNPYILHMLSFYYGNYIVEFKNNMDICENQYVELKSDYSKYKYFSNIKEIEQQYKNESLDIRSAFDHIRLEPNVPQGFYLE
ncbi:ATP-grasp domain-containing protein [Hippea alviniae]|uniref:ATP-grasp domain-containing protein n=1 Tax=Hippea alviniae TaxID=1279027 RepID=UPI0003B352B8|nr:ATP-grasp domain-containing protein [Hippea alviniae]